MAAQNTEFLDGIRAMMKYGVTGSMLVAAASPMLIETLAPIMASKTGVDMTIEATWQAGNSLLFNKNFSQMDLADIGFAGLFGKSGYVAMAMFDYTPQNGLTTIGFGKSEAKFATDMLIGRFNRWHLNKMDNAGIDQSVIKFFNNINSPLQNTIGTGIKQALKNEGEK